MEPTILLVSFFSFLLRALYQPLSLFQIWLPHSKYGHRLTPFRDYTSPTPVNLVLFYHDKNLAPSFVGYMKFMCKTLEVDDWFPLLDKKKKESALKKISKSVRGSGKELKKKGLLHVKSELKSYAGVVKVCVVH